jgi:hypothetical protein
MRIFGEILRAVFAKKQPTSGGYEHLFDQGKGGVSPPAKIEE